MMCVIGWFWHYPSLTYAPGVIVEASTIRAPVAWITYEYVAFGVRHRGQRLMRYSTQFQTYYQVGSSFPVYFVTEQPETSYGPYRPRVQPLIWLGMYVVVLSGAIIFFAWPR
jgi:hypothetical protein